MPRGMSQPAKLLFSVDPTRLNAPVVAQPKLSEPFSLQQISPSAPSMSVGPMPGAVECGVSFAALVAVSGSSTTWLLDCRVNHILLLNVPIPRGLPVVVQDVTVWVL